MITTTADLSGTENTVYTYDCGCYRSQWGYLDVYLNNKPPTGMTINATSGLINWTPATADIGTHPVTVEVTDCNGGSATQSYTLTVSAAPVPEGH